ncbi:MAG: hypothetical protein WBA05_13985 [Gordonia sp. (in: high G+C Gram-positive bacteria)]|uniref:hypothetical protein n=1 Tax=Gordonia TaxID=2053 RepID=UPI003264CB12
MTEPSHTGPQGDDRTAETVAIRRWRLITTVACLAAAIVIISFFLVGKRAGADTGVPATETITATTTEISTTGTTVTRTATESRTHTETETKTVTKTESAPRTSADTVTKTATVTDTTTTTVYTTPPSGQAQ